ncbi:hypothetical protein TRAPUB_711 [Trametes pubescens]|uniref:Uncharacterized protein n=1 Tax=Trametes pubescens TaxID=154538 RepID=A0A1M2VLF4_TRAPU|nr:hypothetical protein TRAPUB_711 [Trametes pubescens]
MLSEWPYFNQVLLVIVHSRFMLGLRGLYFAEGGTAEGEPASRWSGINFRGISSTVVGNLGATLDLAPAHSGHSPRDSSQDAMDREIESEWADEVPQYCDDPFTTGMKEPDVGQEATQDSETIQVSLGSSSHVNSSNTGCSQTELLDGERCPV